MLFLNYNTKNICWYKNHPYVAQVKVALLEEKENQKKADVTCQAVVDGYTELIFLNRHGNVHNPQTINRAIKRISFAVNEEAIEMAEKEKRELVLLPTFSCHNLRHTFCAHFCENETNLKVIQAIMGHKDIATTMGIYAEAIKNAKVKLSANLQDRIKI